MASSEAYYLREKAAQFRRLALEYDSDISSELLEIAAKLEAEAQRREAADGIHAEAETRPTLRHYRVYFRGYSNVILGREDIEAEDDASAMVLAKLLFNACSDMCQRFEVWRGGRALDTPRVNVDAAQLSAETQVRAVAVEERLLESKWTIANSRRLLEQTAKLVEQVKSVRSPDK